jgi:thiol-disulfide isomerase/thioredoxin
VLERLFISVVLIVLAVGLYVAARCVHLWVTRRRLARPGMSAAPGLAGLKPGRPAVLLFSAAGCVPCHAVLKPGLQRLLAELNNRFQVLEIDAESQAEAVGYWNVLSVPTVFVLDPQGTPRHVHYGIVAPGVLRDELGRWL